jgi:hypothetical protein
MHRLIEAERVNADIAQMIYDARIQALHTPPRSR